MKKNKKEKKGAGKPAFFSKPMKRINVMLDEETVKFYTEQGKGNLSEGIRQYWRGLTKREPDKNQSRAKLSGSAFPVFAGYANRQASIR